RWLPCDLLKTPGGELSRRSSDRAAVTGERDSGVARTPSVEQGACRSRATSHARNGAYFAASRRSSGCSVNEQCDRPCSSSEQRLGCVDRIDELFVGRV